MVSKLGRYELRRELARGTIGVVYEARDPLRQKVIALKTLDLAQSDKAREHIRKLFLTDALAAVRLNHPNIVPAYDAGEAQGAVYIAMERLEGQSLRRLLAQSAPLSVARSVKIAADVARGLVYAHEHAVVHRNVTPSNIIVTRANEVRLGDFATGRVNEAFAFSGKRAECLRYAAPEQLGRRLPVDARADIFSLGAVLYEMLTGKPPFSGNSPAEIVRQVLRTEPVLPSEINPEVPLELDGMVLMMLAKDPDRRIASASTVLRDLQRFAEKLDEQELDAQTLASTVSQAAPEPTASTESEKQRAPFVAARHGSVPDFFSSAGHENQANPSARTRRSPDAEPRHGRDSGAEFGTSRAFARMRKAPQAAADFHLLQTDSDALDLHDRRPMFAHEYEQERRGTRRNLGAFIVLALAFGFAGLGVWWLQFRDLGAASIAKIDAERTPAVPRQAPNEKGPLTAEQSRTPKEPRGATAPPASVPVEPAAPAPPPLPPGSSAGIRSIPPAAIAPPKLLPSEPAAPNAAPQSAVKAGSEPTPAQPTAEVVGDPDKTATLVLAVSARDRVYINGKLHQTTPPAITLKIPPGIHRIEVHNSSRLPYLNYVAMQDGETRHLRH
jgi:serine/threonine protein kinase